MALRTRAAGSSLLKKYFNAIVARVYEYVCSLNDKTLYYFLITTAVVADILLIFEGKIIYGPGSDIIHGIFISFASAVGGFAAGRVLVPMLNMIKSLMGRCRIPDSWKFWQGPPRPAIVDPCQSYDLDLEAANCGWVNQPLR